MTLEEQFKKETGKKRFVEIDISGVLIDVISPDYTEWLEEKLTWKKFTEKPPDDGRSILIINTDKQFKFYEHRFNYEDAKPFIRHYPESEWMYVPE
jgi:hypothetical protein